MKRNTYLCVAAVLLLAVGCNPGVNPVDPSADDKQPETESKDPFVPGEESQDPSVTPGDESQDPVNPGEALFGTWTVEHDSEVDMWTFNEDGTVEFNDSWEKRIGSWAFDGSILTQKFTEFWTRDCDREDNGQPKLDENGDYIFLDWVKADWDASETTTEAKVIQDGNVLVQTMKAMNDDGDQYDELFTVLIKEGSNIPSDISALEGKWYWQMFGTPSVRTAVIVTGGRAEIIITPWGERYVGAAEYNNGYIEMQNMTFYTSRYYKDPNDYESYGDWINDLHPEETEWRLPTGDSWSQDGSIGAFHMVFIVDGDVAYSMVANLPAIFYKQ